MADRNLQFKQFGVALDKGIKKSKDGTVLVTGAFTSDNVDESGDVITRAATEAAVPAYRQWGNIRRMHMPDPVGKITRIGEEDGLKWNEVEIKVIDPKAVFEVENGLLQALSVGILIDFKDITELAGGGWEIGAYKLAEISLVDHPANYDARLNLEQSLRSMVRQYGFGALASGVDSILTEELDMTKKVKNVETDETQVEEIVVEASLETTETETAEVVENSAPVEGEEELAAGDPPMEDAPADEPAEDAPEEGDESAEEPTMQSLADGIAALTELVQTLIDSSKASEGVEEPSDGEEQIEESIDAEEDVETDTSVVNREESLPETELPSGELDKTKMQRTTLSLRDALTKHFSS